MIFPVIDPAATGRNIQRLRQARGLSVRDIQRFFNFGEPRVIYMWQRGQCLPSVDNLFALSALLEVPMDAILVPAAPAGCTAEQQAAACCSGLSVHRIAHQARFVMEVLLHSFSMSPIKRSLLLSFL